MPQEVINCVNALGKADGQPDLLTFFDQMGCTIGDTHDPSTPIPGMHPEDTGAHPEDDMNPSDDDDGLADLKPTTTNYDFGHEDNVGITDETPNDSEVVEPGPQDDTGDLEPEVLLVLENLPDLVADNTEDRAQPQPAVEHIDPPEIAGVDDTLEDTPGPRCSTHTQVKPS